MKDVTPNEMFTTYDRVMAHLSDRELGAKPEEISMTLKAWQYLLSSAPDGSLEVFPDKKLKGIKVVVQDFCVMEFK